MRDAGPNHGLVACGRDGISIGPARSVPHGAKPVLDVNSIEPSSRSLPVMTCGCRFREDADRELRRVRRVRLSGKCDEGLALAYGQERIINLWQRPACG